MSDRTGRNDACPCGSGKKYKRCCLGEEAPKPLATQVKPATLMPPPSLRPASPARTGNKSAPEPPPRPRDEWDDWYDRYRVSSLADRLDMLRALLAEDHPPEFYTDIEFVSAVLEAPRYVDDADDAAYIAFLEEMFTRRPEVFNLGVDWFVRQMAYAYVRGGRERDIRRLLPPLLGDEYEPQEAVFDLEDLIRLVGLSEESRRLTFAMLKQTGHGGYMGWAIEELIEFAVFFLHGDAINAGCTPEALSELRRQLAQIDCNPPEDKLNAMLSQRAGTAGRQFLLEDLLGHKEPAGFNLYLLSLDFGRWLAEERQMPSLVADTMRCFVFWCLVEMREKSDRNPLTLLQQRLDKYLARLLGFMSLLHLRGVATLIGMRHFHDFLLSVNLIDEGEHRRARRICGDLWLQMHRALGDTAPDYAFLNKYL